MKLIIVLLLLFISVFADSHPLKSRRLSICKTRTRIHHQGVPVPFSRPAPTKVPLILYYPCALHRNRHKSFPLLILLQGAVTRPTDYTRLATILARRRFVVALPDYTQRRILSLSPFSPLLEVLRRHVRETRRAGLKCPRMPQFGSAQLIVSVLRFFMHAPTASRLSRIRKRVQLKDVIIFGHSFGGVVADLFFTRACIPLSAPVDLPPDEIFQDPVLASQFFLRFPCEQYVPVSFPRVRVAGFISFESIAPESNITVAPGVFHVAMNSPFSEALYNTLFSGVSVDGKLVRVLISNSNHFSPNNFVEDSENQTPLCNPVRMPPEDMFRTTKEQQERAIKSVAKTIVVSYKVFVKGRSVKRLTALTERKDLSIETVSVLSG